MSEKELKRVEMTEEVLEDVNGGGVVSDLLGQIDVVDLAKAAAVSAIRSTTVGKVAMDVVDLVNGAND